MQALSVHTALADPYRAGLFLGEALRELAPDVVFLFSSTHYGASSEVLEALHDALGRPGTLIMGCSGDGVYEQGGVSEIGLAALGIATGPAVRWHLASARGLTADPAGATRSCLASLEGQLDGSPPAFLILLADFHGDATRIEQVLRAETQVPVVGGLAADAMRLERCHLFVQDEVLDDCVVLLAASGAIAFDIQVGNGLATIGQTGRIEEAAGTEVRTIAGMSAAAFVEQQTGRPLLGTDIGVLSLQIHEPAEPSLKRLRSLSRSTDHPAGVLGLYGGIAPGEVVQVAQASTELLRREVATLAGTSRALPFSPAAALVVSCAGRKRILGTEIGCEVALLRAAHPEGLPLVGFPSFGEIAPLHGEQGYSRNLFHNMTYVLLTMGSPP